MAALVPCVSLDDVVASVHRFAYLQMAVEQLGRAAVREFFSARPYSPLHACAERSPNSQEEVDDIVKCFHYLVTEVGLPVDGLDKHKRTPLLMLVNHHRTSSREQARPVEALLNLGANPNVRSDDARIPFHRAIINGDHFVVEIMLKYGASLTANGIGTVGNVFHIAAREANLQVLEQLLSAARQSLDQETFQSLFRAKSRDDTPLQILLRMERLDAVSLLCKAGVATLADIHYSCNISVKLARTVIESILNGVEMVKAPQNFWLMHNAITFEKTDVVEYLVSLGVSPLVANPETRSSGLHIAAKWNKPEILDFLLDQLSDEGIDTQDAFGNTPLHYAAAEDSKECAMLLLEHGAEVAMEKLPSRIPMLILSFDSQSTLSSIDTSRLPENVKGVFTLSHGSLINDASTSDWRSIHPSQQAPLIEFYSAVLRQLLEYALQQQEDPSSFVRVLETLLQQVASEIINVTDCDGKEDSLCHALREMDVNTCDK